MSGQTVDYIKAGLCRVAELSFSILRVLFSPEMKPQLSTRLKDVVTDFADNTSCHGVGSISRSKHIAWKLVWSAVFLVAVGFLIRQLVTLLFRYQSFPKSTKVEVKSSALNFPSVTICNMNSLRLTAIEAHVDPLDEYELYNLQKLIMKSHEEDAHHSSKRKVGAQLSIN